MEEDLNNKKRERGVHQPEIKNHYRTKDKVFFLISFSHAMIYARIIMEWKVNV